MTQKEAGTECFLKSDITLEMFTCVSYSLI